MREIKKSVTEKAFNHNSDQVAKKIGKENAM